MHMRFTAFILLAAASYTFAAPAPLVISSTISARANETVNPNAATGTSCTDRGVSIVDHDINVALLQICGGIAGSIEFCGGNPSSTTGASGTAKLALKVVNSGATINVSKGRWEGCMRAARATCGDSPFTSTCIGGTTNGNFKFTLTHA